MSDEIALPSEAEIIRRFIEFRLADLHTCMPGQVVTFDKAKNTAAIQPLLQRVYVDAAGEETVRSAPILQDVPVLFPRGGFMRITWHPVPGDIVLLLFCERSIDKWATTGGEVDPQPRRKHDWSDAVAIPGLAPLSNPIPGIEPGQLRLGSEEGSPEIILDATVGRVIVNGLRVMLGGEEGSAIARLNDQITISIDDNPEFYQWISAASSAGPATVPPYTGSIIGKIVTGSAKVSAE